MPASDKPPLDGLGVVEKCALQALGPSWRSVTTGMWRSWVRERASGWGLKQASYGWIRDQLQSLSVSLGPRNSPCLGVEAVDKRMWRLNRQRLWKGDWFCCFSVLEIWVCLWNPQHSQGSMQSPSHYCSMVLDSLLTKACDLSALPQHSFVLLPNELSMRDVPFQSKQ